MTPTLELLPDTFAICRLEPDASIPDWAQGEFVSMTRTAGELSVVCPQDRVPEGDQSEAGFRCLRVADKLSFSLVGVIASLTKTLADVEVSVFVVSTFDTDYLLVKDCDLAAAVKSLIATGHSVSS